MTLYLHVARLELEALALALFLCALPLVVLAAWAWLVWQIEGVRIATAARQAAMDARRYCRRLLRLPLAER